jgi:hypothetical protein
VFLPQPALDQPLAAELLVLHECLTQEGLGGRLGAAIETLVGRDVSFEVLPAGETDQVVLLARAQDEVVVPLWEAVSQVLNSFRLRPPSETELREAAARARLRLLEQATNPADWLRLLSRLAYRGVPPATFTRVLRRLTTPGQLDIAAALPVFATASLALAVVGGEPPAESSRLVQLVTGVLLPEARAERSLPPDAGVDAVAEADALLRHVVAALGGETALKLLRGYRERVVSETGVGPPVETESVLRLDDRLRQTTRVLATTIETRIEGSGGIETCGAHEVPLPVDEARGRLAAAARHPAVVLARWCRGEVRFRRLALRMAGDRELAVLEEVTERQDPLRLSVDTGSFLVRAIEVRTWNPETGSGTVRDELSDYRTVKRLRVPFLRTRIVDDSGPPLQIRTLAFDPTEPTDGDLR